MVASNPARVRVRLNLATTSGSSGARNATWKSLRKWAAVAAVNVRRSKRETAMGVLSDSLCETTDAPPSSFPLFPR